MNSRPASTEPGSASLRPTAAELERAFGEVEMRNLPPITRVLAAFFAILGTAYLILLAPAIGMPLFVMSLLMALVFLGVSEYVRRTKLSTKGILWCTGLVALAASVGALVSMHVIRQPSQVVGAALLLLGLGVFVVSLYWYLLVMSVSVVGWLILVWRAGATADWLTTVILLGGAAALSVCIHILRQRIFLDLERTRLQQAQQQEQLEHALREQERIQGELRETESRFRTLVEQLPAATFLDALDPSATTIYVSPQIETITGYTPAEWLAKAELWEKMLHPDDRARTLERLRRHQETGERFVQDYRIFARDGRLVWIHDEAVVVKDASGTPVYSQGYMTDITERIQVEDALRRRDAIFETVRYAAETFLRASSWEDRIERVLARLGTTTQVSRVYLDENETTKDETRLTTQRYEWCAPNPEARIETEQAPVSQHAARPDRWETALMMGVPVYGEAADFPAEERAFLQMQGIQSLAVIPVFVGREWWGTIGFEVCDRPHSWASMELDALQAAANTLGAAIQRRRDERAVAAARDLALEASRLKSEFLAMMSHEIRTPMNTIVGMSELLLESPLTAEQREYADSVRYASDVLLTIINDILDFSKIEAGRFTLEPVAFYLPDLIAGSVELLAPTAREKGLDLRFEVSPNVPPDLIGDAGRLRQVLINLLSNAVKFTEKGRVVLAVEGDEETGNKETAKQGDLSTTLPGSLPTRLNFAVSDTGIGISAETRARLFQPFMQGDMSITRRYGGTGLGLAISLRLVELMGGEIGVESVEGQGSTFRFCVPFQIQATSAPGQEEFKAGPPKPDRGRGLVLLADDNAANQKLAQLQLELLGVREIEMVATGLAVVTAIRNAARAGKEYGLVLMDCQMPEMDGFAAARAIRQLEQGTGQHLPIVALTASAMVGDREACIAAGMDDYIAKPLRLDALRTALDRWLPLATETADSGARAEAILPREIAQANAAPMDFRILETLRELEAPENPNGTRELAHAYLDETRARIELLTTALTNQELTQARSIAHSIRGSSASLGARRLAELANEIEKCAQTENAAHAVEMLPALREEFERVSAALRAEAFVSY